MLELIKKKLAENSCAKQAKILQGYFKTAEGEYGEGDIFIGVRMPDIRKIAKTYYRDLSKQDTIRLLKSDIHEERMTALIMLLHRYDKGSVEEREDIFELYLSSTKWINNWDLVDVTAPHIVGRHLADKKRDVLYNLAESSHLWDKRISIIACHYFIRHNDFTDILKIASMLIHDGHDLINKALGWMLREVGKRDQAVEESYLKLNYKQMPRTMLRYAIERFDEALRQSYLKGEI